MSSLATTIEAILYLKGQPLSLAKLAELARCEREDIEEGLIDLMDDYAHRDGALEIVETVDGYCLQLKERYRFLVDMLIPLDLGVGALRTLAAIALKGPISQTDLVDLRGSGAYQHVQELLTQGFVRKRKQSDSRSSLVQVTDKFYQHFEIDQLPKLRPKSPGQPAADDLVDEDDLTDEPPEEDSVTPETPGIDL
ncbi:SMC-Scp complex subunit ScpB [Phormidium sp. FACHB-1136]|uniref:SMC-Scp complex subunit ScpB n=1 Tax=Phormidium sp. FACHB-1136 TaxID=2692848 RepID=UPI001687A02D|nr:SMC-Scp complex subunit ScpB [Phormidium sp. FACHB-1136]MBD2425758.1 SMC-Scp complex subunit ScpB [Phormidium sp. FACHB-1136]